MILIFAFIVAWIVFTILVKVIKTTVKTAFMIAAIIVLLQVAYNISPLDIWHYIMQLPQILSQLGISN